MIQKKIKEHSMGVITRWKVSQPFLDGGRPVIPYEERIIHRWVLRIPVYSPSAQGLTTDKLFIVRVESLPTLHIDREIINGNYIPVRQAWNPIEIKIVDFIGGSEEEHYNLLRDWMQSENYKKTISLERVDPTGYTVDKWVLEGSFIQEMHHEIVYDRTIGDIGIRINYDYATKILN